MDQLWAPWRGQYIRENSSKPRDDGECFLCRGLKAARELDRENLLAYRGEGASIFLNRYPYNNGHLLVVPHSHHGSMDQFEPDELTAPIPLIRDAIDAITAMMRPQGFNVGLNLGKTAGAGLPGHLHWHIVPRWEGDTNFMPVLGDTRVIVESLFEFYDRFAEEFSRRKR